MYFPTGWPKLLDTSLMSSELYKICCDRVKVLFAILSTNELAIYYAKPCVPITVTKRSDVCVENHGQNAFVEWKPDSSQIVVVTERSTLLIYSVEICNQINGIYNQNDSPYSNLRRESAELFVKESVPSLFLKLTTVVPLDIVITCIVITGANNFMVGTNTSKILRLRWDGTEDRDYTLDLKRIPFGINQQVNYAVPIDQDNVHVVHMDYSPLLGGFSVTLNDGRSAFLSANNLKFDPNQVNGIWAQNLDDATVTAINHKYRLIAYGRKNSQANVYVIDELTGGLELSHVLALSAKDFPGAPGHVRQMIWTPDGCAILLSWSNGGISLWSTFGAMLMCSLGWDYGLHVDLVKRNPLNIMSMEWSTEGYQLLCIQSQVKSLETFDEKENISPKQPNVVFVLDFVKSVLALNPCMSSNSYILLQGDDKLYVNHGESLQKVYSNSTFKNDKYSPNLPENKKIMQVSSTLSESKNWIVVTLPSTYSATNWPIRYSAIDDKGQNISVAGRTGVALYSMPIKKWKLFGNETQEKDFVVTGGLLWWNDFTIMGTYNLMDFNDEIRLYPKDSKLDNRFSRKIQMDSPIMLLNCFKHQLIVFTADACISIFNMLQTENQSIELTRLNVYNIKNLCVHPACVVSISITNLKNESAFRINQVPTSETIILNVSGRVLMVQKENNRNSTTQLTSVCLASSVECIWISNSQKTHLKDSLWFFCGCYGMRVWLPVFPRENDGNRSHRHTFMSKRIMLSFILRIYPMAILFEDAIILGVENDTMLYSNDPDIHFSLPFCTIERTSQVYLHQILRQLIRRNLGYNAWEIARTCTSLPYFPHALELLLHEVLEEEATSKEPIPDALLPSILDFIQEFPVYLQTVVQCARKTEIMHWKYLFAAAGKPKDLFQQCLSANQLETAASYLIILQNLEPSSISRQYATLLLDLALEYKNWELGRDLVRFLRAIDPNDVESPRNSFILGNKFPTGIQVPSLSANDEELSLILGTMSRGRSYSTTIIPKQNEDSPTPTSKERSNNDVVHRRKKSVPNKDKEKQLTAQEEDFFIDIILQRHAKRMLQLKKLEDLGQMAAKLDFQLVRWLSKEKETAAKIEDFVHALKQLHDELNWPKPFWDMSLLKYDSNSVHYVSSSYTSIVDTNVDTNLTVDDSGYKSHTDILHPATSSAKMFKLQNEYSSKLYDPVLSENALKKLNLNYTLFQEFPESSAEDLSKAEDKLNGKKSYLGDAEAKLLPTSFVRSCASEQESLWDEDNIHSISYEVNEMDQNDLNSQTSINDSNKLTIKLRYLLQIFIEAECWEMALLLSILLLDIAAVGRIVNAAIRANSLSKCRLLRNGLKDITRWSFNECLGYKSFMLSLQNHILTLDQFVLKQESIPTPKSEFTLKNTSVDIETSIEQSNKKITLTSGDMKKFEKTTVEAKHRSKTTQNEIRIEQSPEQNGCSLM